MGGRDCERVASASLERVAEPEPCDAPTLYLGLDGTGVPARNTEVQGRCGKQPDGSAKTREAKLAVVWSAQTTDPVRRSRRATTWPPPAGSAATPTR